MHLGPLVQALPSSSFHSLVLARFLLIIQMSRAVCQECTDNVPSVPPSYRPPPPSLYRMLECVLNTISVCVCLCVVCMCMHIRSHTDRHTHTHAHTYKQEGERTHTDTHKLTNKQVHPHTQTHTHKQEGAHMHAHTHAHAHTHTHTLTHAKSKEVDLYSAKHSSSICQFCGPLNRGRSCLSRIHRFCCTLHTQCTTLHTPRTTHCAMQLPSGKQGVIKALTCDKKANCATTLNTLNSVHI